jgi:hypothetical protein
MRYFAQDGGTQERVARRAAAFLIRTVLMSPLGTSATFKVRGPMSAFEPFFGPARVGLFGAFYPPWFADLGYRKIPHGC